MVWLTSDTTTKYPYIHRYYKEVFSHIDGRAGVFRPWMKYNALEDDDTGRRTLSFVNGKGPELRFQSASAPGCDFLDAANIGGSSGDVAKGQKDKLLVGMTWAITVSNKLTIIAEEVGELANAALMYMFDKEKSYNEGHRKVVRLLEAITLHELIHWSWYRQYGSDGSDREKEHWKGDQEGGTYRFEREAYGQTIVFNWHAVCRETLVEANFGWALKNYASPGPTIEDVLKYGVSYNAGIMKGDIVLAIDGNRIIMPEFLSSFKKSIKLGSYVSVDIQRRDLFSGKDQPMTMLLYFPLDKQADARQREGIN